MYKAFVRSQVRSAYAAISAGDMGKVTSSFADDARFQMVGDHPFGGEQVGRAAIERWFERTHEVFPDLRLEPLAILVNGPPWSIRVAVRFRVTATLADGGRYENHGMQFLRLRGPTVLEDRLYEDTQVLADAIERQLSARGEPVA
jgi:ketosteroid isomerase-like protein